MRNRQRFFWFIWLLVLFWPAGIGKADELPEESRLEGVVGHAQAFSLSCESRSASDWAAYWGIYIDESRFLRNLPRSDNPDIGFVGNPRGVWGQVPPRPYGVHAEPVAALLREYGLPARAQRGFSYDELRAEIVAGRPVIVWVIGQMWSGKGRTYAANDGQSVLVAPFEHTMIFTGYDHRRVYVVDAYTGQNQSYPVGVFLESWGVLGNMVITSEVIPGMDVVSEENTPLLANEMALLADQVVPQPGVEAPAPEPPETTERAYTQYLLMIFNGFQPLPTSPQATVEQVKPDVYIVRSGDYLMQVSRKVDVDWQTLVRLNGLIPPYWLHPGQVLKLR